MANLSFFVSVRENGNTSDCDFCHQIDDPRNDIADKRDQNQNSNYKRYDISGLHEPDDAVNPADEDTEENLKNNFRKLRQAFIGFCKGTAI